jgi:demethylmenaquinone methyltransferase/2-methoxy-6-polyprenyl-1,4-benzoquinol methylase
VIGAPDKSAPRIESMFDAIAGRYDLLNHVLSAGIDRLWRKRAIRTLQLTGTERVLDLCSGTADLAIEARRAVPPAARVVGVDFSEAMLRVGWEKLTRWRLDPTIALVRGDAMRIPTATGSVDAVTIAFGIRNVERPEIACREMHRVLRPRGRLAILEFAIPSSPLIRAGYLAYFRFVLPRIGQVVSRHNAAYAYLPASVAAFETPDQLVKILRQAGFTDVRAVPLTFGVVYLYTAQRAALTNP